MPWTAEQSWWCQKSRRPPLHATHLPSRYLIYLWAQKITENVVSEKKHKALLQLAITTFFLETFLLSDREQGVSLVLQSHLARWKPSVMSAVLTHGVSPRCPPELTSYLHKMPLQKLINSLLALPWSFWETSLKLIPTTWLNFKCLVFFNEVWITERHTDFVVERCFALLLKCFLCGSLHSILFFHF